MNVANVMMKGVPPLSNGECMEMVKYAHVKLISFVVNKILSPNKIYCLYSIFHFIVNQIKFEKVFSYESHSNEVSYNERQQVEVEKEDRSSWWIEIKC